MDVVFSKAGAFVLIIILGYVLKRKGVFTLDSFSVLSQIVVRITLPAAIVANFTQIDVSGALLSIILIGILVNVIMIIVPNILNKGKSIEEKTFDIVNLNGHNVGSFTIPFVQSFLGPLGFAATSMFDVGNAIMCVGFTPIIATSMLKGQTKFKFSSIIKIFTSSYAFTAYIIMTILGMLHIQLPSIVLMFAETAGKANAFIALFLIGIGFEIRLERAKILTIGKILTIRYVLAILFCLFVYFILPFELEIRQALVIVLLGPIASVAAVYSEQLKLDVELASAINSLSILISIVLITCTLLFLI